MAKRARTLYLKPGPANAGTKHLDLALEALKVIAFWAEIEADLAIVLAAMLKSDVATGVAMYEALSMGEGRRSALRAAARRALLDWLAKLFEVVQVVLKPSRNQRNNFAHGIWAITEDLPDALLLMHSSVVTKRSISYRQFHNIDGGNIVRPEIYDYSAIKVYKASDITGAKSNVLDVMMRK